MTNAKSALCTLNYFRPHPTFAELRGEGALKPVEEKLSLPLPSSS